MRCRGAAWSSGLARPLGVTGGEAGADLLGRLDGSRVGEGFGDARLEQFVEQRFLAVERAQARADDFADRGRR